MRTSKSSKSEILDNVPALCGVRKRESRQGTEEVFMKRYASMLVLTFLGALTAWKLFGQTKSTTGGSHENSNQGADDTVRTLPLPDNSAGDGSSDYIAYEPITDSVWGPGGI